MRQLAKLGADATPKHVVALPRHTRRNFDDDIDEVEMSATCPLQLATLLAAYSIFPRSMSLFLHFPGPEIHGRSGPFFPGRHISYLRLSLSVVCWVSSAMLMNIG